MGNASTLEKIEIEIETAKAYIEDKEAILKLRENKFFKQIILERYFKEEAVSLVMLKGKNIPPDQMIQVDHAMYGISALKSFLDSIVDYGVQLEQQLRDSEQTRTEILKEDIQ